MTGYCLEKWSTHLLWCPAEISKLFGKDEDWNENGLKAISITSIHP